MRARGDDMPLADAHQVAGSVVVLEPYTDLRFQPVQEERAVGLDRAQVRAYG